MGFSAPVTSAIKSLDLSTKGVAARLHLALSADSESEGTVMDLVADAERVMLKSPGYLEELVEGQWPIAWLLHRIWRKLRKPTLAKTAAKAKVEPLTAMTLHGCRCRAEWSYDGVACGAASFGCCISAGRTTPWCLTTPGCPEHIDECFPATSTVGGSLQPSKLAPPIQAFLRQHDMDKCSQLQAVSEIMPRDTLVLDIGAGTISFRTDEQSDFANHHFRH